MKALSKNYRFYFPDGKSLDRCGRFDYDKGLAGQQDRIWFSKDDGGRMLVNQKLFPIIEELET
jgi:hypothetical protein